MESGAGPSTSSTGRGVGAGASMLPAPLLLVEGGEGEEALSLPALAPRHEVVGEDASYLLSAVLR